MAEKRPPVDVVLVGFGWTAAIMAQELTEAGLEVLALERGGWRDTGTDFPTTHAPDELRYYWRHAMFLETARETQTFRNRHGQTALPIRRWGSYLPGVGVGGAGVHWNGQTFRFLPSDFIARSHNEDRYGELPEEMTVQDYGVTYDELEPHFDRFEKLCGISGRAGNIQGRIVEGGNPFEGWRSDEYPNPPMEMTFAQDRFEAAADGLGLHPFPAPSANMSRAYTNPLGVQMAPCTYCGFCEKFGCGNFSKASPQTTVIPVLMKKPNFHLRTHCEVLQVLKDRNGERATGVLYVDAHGKQWEQPAEIVILCGYQLSNTRLMMLSGIGEIYDPQTGDGLVGKNYTYQVMSGVDIFFEEEYTNEFIGAGALGMVVSAHRTPERLRSVAQGAEAAGYRVLIAGAGGAAHLPGMLAANTQLPVFGVPVRSRALQGVDSLLSIVQMPAGVPVGTLAIGEAGATNAALLAAAVLALHDPALRERLRSYRAQQTERVEADTLPTPAFRLP